MEEYIRYGLRSSVEEYFKDSVSEDYDACVYSIYELARDHKAFADLRLPLQMFEDATEIFGLRRHFNTPHKGIVEILRLMEEDKYDIFQRAFVFDCLIGYYKFITNFNTKPIVDALETQSKKYAELCKAEQAKTEKLSDLIGILRGLFKLSIHYSSLVRLALKTPKPAFGIFGPDYRSIYIFFDEHHPDSIYFEKEAKISYGFKDLSDKFFRQLKYHLESLETDQANRISFLKKLFKNIHVSPDESKKLYTFGEYTQSDDFVKMQSEIDIDTWKEIYEIGLVCFQSAINGSFIGNKIEEELAADNLWIEGGWLDLKKKALDEHKSASNHINLESNLNITDQLSGIPQVKAQTSSAITLSFVDAFFDEARASDIVEKLKRLYVGGNYDQYAYMLYALYDLGLIADPATVNKTKLFHQLTATFGEIGTRQNLTAHINRLNAPNQQESIDIQTHKKNIQRAK
ncbi:hypothetical protein [Spirosoma endophyticum]|uniref:Uncharacterized protein n=1 Tax=Spirosoma endophyticum TaxID=662367 RepID=A0A1I2H6U7_9BACT|nr:hypothetical protein [Spirosoma endophyticum]SFF25914.1 hypothetical protein SAMN05216167_13916 [Spirosoma endophyticum]